MQKDAVIERTIDFRWNSRFELYEYFKLNYGLEQFQIDQEIYETMERFRYRKGQVIKTQELWQKVGLNLEAKYLKHMYRSEQESIFDSLF